jgi:hypothetical protein
LKNESGAITFNPLQKLRVLLELRSSSYFLWKVHGPLVLGQIYVSESGKSNGSSPLVLFVRLVPVPSSSSM